MKLKIAHVAVTAVASIGLLSYICLTDADRILERAVGKANARAAEKDIVDTAVEGRSVQDGGGPPWRSRTR